MLILGKKAKTEEEAIKILSKNIENGKALEKFKELIIQQSGNPEIINDYSLLPMANNKYELRSEKSGFIYETDTAMIGRASVETGAGRTYKEQELDYGAGIILKKRIGDKVEKDEVIATIYSSTEEKCILASNILKEAIKISDIEPKKPTLILDVIS